ncbi:MAG: wax ester/triacylglycerol synthase family O-acyltransferase [Betaproteobacteria bacterium]|nr:wax ester/triacylglycerol synthase family O-acyltransferase [Betaproteobacteria bacterium]
MSTRRRHRERISSVDTAWLRMDRPNNLMQIVGVLIFDGRADYERLKRTVALRMLRYRRFRQIAAQAPTGAWWIDDANFDIDAHLHHALLPAPGDKGELQKFVAELASVPLNPARPRWEFHLVETAGGDSALVARIHHAIADGIALIGVMDSLTDPCADAPEDGGVPASPDTADDGGSGAQDSESRDNDDFWRQVAGPVGDAALSSAQIGGKAWEKALEVLNNPDKLADYARVAGAIAEEAAGLLLMDDDSPTRFKGKPGTVKRVAWSEPVSLPQVKAVGRVLGCSVNDLLLSSVAGALNNYLREKGDPVAGVEIRALVPVNLRACGDIKDLGNRFGLVALELPVGIENPLARLYATRGRMLELKGSYQAALTFSLLGAAGMAPMFVQQQILDLLSGKATAVMTNVPGPREPRFLAGAALKQQMFWVPQSGDIGLGVSILSYNGKVQFGLIADKGLVGDPERIVDRFAIEFEKLLWLVLMEPWDRLGDPVAVEEGLGEISGLI